MYLIGKHIFDNILNNPKLILSIQLNCFKYFYQTRINLITINHLFVHS